jgi:type II secretory pathway component PulF
MNMIHSKEVTGKLRNVLDKLAWKLQDFLAHDMAHSLLTALTSGANSHADDGHCGL